MVEAATNDIEARKRIAKKFLDENPHHVLVEFRKKKKSQLDCFEKKHLLIPSTYSFHHVVMDFTQRIASCLGEKQALFFYINGKKILPKLSETMSELYRKCKSEDDFLIIEFTEIDAFG